MDQTILINNPENIWLGKVIKNKYKIMALLGSGASSDVYLCENLSIGNRVVVKIVQLENKNKYDFHKEIEVLAKVHHPNLPLIIDTYQDDQYLYIVETYIEGQTLEEKLKAELVLEEGVAQKYFEQLLDIIKYMHNLKPQPIVYKDIKPSNIIVNEENKVYIIDFGISKLHNDLVEKETHMSGTKDYAAPEQWDREKSIDMRADIYSLGALTYKILIGEPYKDNFEKLDANINVDDEFKSIIKKCMASNIDKRYQTIEEIIKDFQQVTARNNQVQVGKKVFVVDGVHGVGKSTVISGLANVYSKRNIKTVVLDMSDKFGITLFWDVQKTQMMKYMVNSDDYEAIKKIAIKPNKNLYIYKMGKLGDESIIIFINKVLKFADVVFIECNKSCTKKLFDHAHEIILVTKQEEKYMYATMQLLNQYTKGKVYLENLKVIINDYTDIAGEKERIADMINKRLIQVTNKRCKTLVKIPSIKRKIYIENLQKGNPIYKNDEIAHNAFIKISEGLYENKPKSSLIEILEEAIKNGIHKKK